MDEEHTPAQPAQHSRKPFIIAGIIVLALVFIFVLGKSGLNLKMSGAKPSPSAEPSANKGGRMFLTTDQGTHVFPVGKEFTVDLRIDTKSQEVGGFDAVILYDDHIVEFVKAENLIPEFEMFSNVIAFPGDSGKSLTVTGIMQLEKQMAFKFQEDPVARLTFKSKKAGSTTLSFQFTQGETNDSNLVLLNTDEILSEVENLPLSFGSTQSLKVGQTYTHPTTGLTAKLEKVTVPEANCNDCTTDANITLSYKGSQSMLKFTNGGFAGKVVDTQGALQHTIEVKNITAQSVEISVIPQLPESL